MRKYELIEAMTFRAGRFLLTDEQLRRRRYLVNVVEGNLVEPRTELSFKRGEIVCTDAEVPKALEHKMRPVVEPDAAPPESADPEQLDAEEDPESELDLDLADIDPPQSNSSGAPDEQQPRTTGKRGGRRS